MKYLFKNLFKNFNVCNTMVYCSYTVNGINQLDQGNSAFCPEKIGIDNTLLFFLCLVFLVFYIKFSEFAITLFFSSSGFFFFKVFNQHYMSLSLLSQKRNYFIYYRTFFTFNNFINA